MTATLEATDRRAPFGASASATYRRDPSANQDAVVVIDEGAWCGLVVADGIGSWERSGLAARAAVEAAADALRAHGPVAVEEAVEAAHRAVLALAPDGPAGTTLLLATVPAPGDLLTAYIGNGALLVVSRTPGRELGARAAGRTLCSNHLLPHVALEGGREVLSRVLSTELGGLPTPVASTMWLSPDVPVALALVTDGIWSEEQAPVGLSGGQRWIQETPVLGRTTAALEVLLATREDGPHAAQALLEDHLAELQADGLLEDDATIGVLLP